jgi:hypothetical protein
MMDVLRHVHRDATVRECLAAALHISRKEPLCREVERSADVLVLEKTTPIEPGLSKTLGIPTAITYLEKWHIGMAETFLVNASMSAGAFTLQIGSHYSATADGGVTVQSKVHLVGLESLPLMRSMFETYVKCEFAARRNREACRIVRARAQAKRDAVIAAPEPQLAAAPSTPPQPVAE